MAQGRNCRALGCSFGHDEVLLLIPNARLGQNPIRLTWVKIKSPKRRRWKASLFPIREGSARRTCGPNRTEAGTMTAPFDLQRCFDAAAPVYRDRKRGV